MKKDKFIYQFSHAKVKWTIVVKKNGGKKILSLLSWFDILIASSLCFSHVLVTTHNTKLHREPNVLCYITQGA